MKVICDRGALLEAVNLVAAVVPARTPSPQLSCVKLEAKKAAGGSELTLTGSDGDTALVISIPQVDVAQAGQALVLADKLRQIVSAEEGEPTLTLESGGAQGSDQVHIRGANAHFRVFGYPPADYPPVPEFSQVLSATGRDAPKAVFAPAAGTLLQLVSRTSFATARETSRYAINGVLLKRDGKKLEMVATDGRRLAVARTTVPSAGGADKADRPGPVQCIIPTKALTMIQRLVYEDEAPVRIAITESRVYFAFDHPGAEGKNESPRALLSSSLVEGSFPPYEDVIPKDQDKRIVADREDLSSAVRKAAVLTNEESRGVRMAFTKQDKRLKLMSRAPEMGEAEIQVGLNTYEGDDIEISFNPAFITDVLKVVTEPEVIVELKAANKPGLIRSSNSDFMYVVMPVNLPS
ncbi:MAG TPA: DNA polymerase III subunit beta [Phycisphaerales bacterium]|nr:DNA polymerase III subunit beta [Phycisphaerales bacterium]